jgi:protein gp37
MSSSSKIEWTEATWNPVRGCVKISPGCTHCYAETFAERFRGVPGHPYEQGFDPRLVPTKLREPLSWSKPKMIFVNSMSDLFQDFVQDDYIVEVVKVMMEADSQHIWWGVSVEDRKYGVGRIEHLQAANVAVRFLSVEPLLEDIGTLNLDGIHWVIVGGESGPGARPMPETWVQSVLTQCRAAGVHFFFKQWGGVRKSETGRELNGRTYDEMPSRQTRERIGQEETPTRHMAVRIAAARPRRIRAAR